MVTGFLFGFSVMTVFVLAGFGALSLVRMARGK